MTSDELNLLTPSSMALSIFTWKVVREFIVAMKRGSCMDMMAPSASISVLSTM